MKLCLPKDLKVGDRVQARGHAACGLDTCINQDGVCMRCLWKVKGLRRCRSPHRGAELAPQPRRPRSAREGLRGHRAVHVPVLRRGRLGHRRSRPRRERTYLAAVPPLCLMMRTVCVWVGCVPSAARTPFPVIGSCVKLSELIFNTPRRHQLAAQTYHTLQTYHRR